MLEKVGHIRNPLTVIAIFAALAEVSGTIVLPFLDVALQGTYVWFLMLFPVLLVLAFFVTLNFNRRALYAPSDFREEKHFVDLATPASPEAREAKLFAELTEAKKIEARTLRALPPPMPYSPARPSVTDESRASKIQFSQAVVLQLISQELKRPIAQGIKLIGRHPSQGILFDGLLEEGDVLTVVEVKYFPSSHFQTSEVREFLDRIDRLHADLSTLKGKSLRLIFAVVTDEDEKGQIRIRNRISATIGRFATPIDLRVYSVSSLVQTIEVNLSAPAPKLEATLNNALQGTVASEARGRS